MTLQRILEAFAAVLLTVGCITVFSSFFTRGLHDIDTRPGPKRRFPK